MTSPNSDPKLDLEDAVVARLRDEGLLKSGGRSRTVLWGWLAALVLGLGGLAAVSLSTSQRSSDLPTSQMLSNVYVIAMYGGPEYRPLSADDSRLREHAEWAASHQTGPAQIIRGGPLKDPIAEFGQVERTNRRFIGFFTVRARTAADAVKLAESAPHLRHGGSVVVYPASS